MRKPDFAYANTKALISFSITAQLISAFVFRFTHMSIVQSCDCSVYFACYLVRNPEDSFSGYMAQS